MKDKIPNESPLGFWDYYDKASDRVQLDPEWHELEFKVNSFLSAAPNSSILQSNLLNLIDKQYTMLMSEMFMIIMGK